MDKLLKLREKIDETDRKMAELFECRMQTVGEIAKYKKENNMPIFDQNRECEVIEKNTKHLKNREFEDVYKKFIKNVILLSREYQQNKEGK